MWMSESLLGMISIPNLLSCHHHTSSRKHGEGTKAAMLETCVFGSSWCVCVCGGGCGQKSVCVCVAADVCG